MSKGNARETIDYYNRKFVVNITGTYNDADGEMGYTIPPLNETAFSSGYNQCLIRMKSVIISNAGVANFNDQVNPVFVLAAGGGMSNCPAGVVVRTSIPSRQVKHISNNYFAAGYPNLHDQSFHQIISPECKQSYIRSATAIDGVVTRGSKQVYQTPLSSATAPHSAIDVSVNFFEYQDGGSFEDSAVLCGVPFGQSHKIQLRDAFNGAALGGLASGLNQANGRNNTTISIKLEILMLPNPTPQDR